MLSSSVRSCWRQTTEGSKEFASMLLNVRHDRTDFLDIDLHVARNFPFLAHRCNSCKLYCIGGLLSWSYLSVVVCLSVWLSSVTPVHFGQTVWARITNLGQRDDLGPISSLTENDVTSYCRSAVVRQNAWVGFNSARSLSVFLFILRHMFAQYHRITLT